MDEAFKGKYVLEVVLGNLHSSSYLNKVARSIPLCQSIKIIFEWTYKESDNYFHLNIYEGLPKISENLLVIT